MAPRLTPNGKRIGRPPKDRSPKPQARQFVVGDGPDGCDFTQAQIDALCYKISLWFQDPDSGRLTDDPIGQAKEKIRECLLAINNQGEPWKRAPVSFQKRIKVKCGYDMVKDRGIPTKTRGTPRKVPGAYAAARGIDASNPVEAAFDDETYRQKVERDILEAFPELDNPAHRPNVRSLSGLYAQREIIDQELSFGVPAARRDALLKTQKIVEEMADGTMRRLGIHPDQVRKKIQEKTASTIADAVAMVEADQDFPEWERTWALQRAQQLWWMSEHPSGDGARPQQHPWEVWHATRSRPVRHVCECGADYVLVEGFQPHELYAYLLDRGVVVEEPITGLADREALAKMRDFFAATSLAGEKAADETDDDYVPGEMP